MHSQTQTYTTSELALSQRQRNAQRRHKSTVLKTLQEQLNLLANSDLLLEKVLDTLTQVFTFDALVEHVYPAESKTYVMRDKRYKDLQASHKACQQQLAQMDKQNAQLQDRCMRLEAELTSSQKLLAESEKSRADMTEAPQKRRRASKYPLCSFSDSETSSEFREDQDSSDEDVYA